MSSLSFSFLIDGEELQLPVPPLPFGWGAGQTVREITVNGTGRIYLPGDPAAHSGPLECLLPARDYPFVAAGASLDPYYYIDKLKACVTGRKIVRYVVPGVINERVIIEEVTYEERDGTDDVYAKIYLKASPELKAVTTEAGTGAGTNSGRGDPEEVPAAQTYTVVTGDCLSVICRRFYGDGRAEYYNALAAYNGIKNPHLIFPGQVLTIPAKSQLGVSG